MLAYTAWDSLRTIAREYDADLTMRPEGWVELSPHRARSFSPAAIGRVVKRVGGGLAVLLAIASSVA